MASEPEWEQRRGVLYPRRLPEFHRLPPPRALEHLVRWFWIPEWDLADDVRVTQELLPFPACNLVVEVGRVSAVGPATARSERVLSGRGWAVGALLRPAAVPSLVQDPAGIRDAARSLEAPELGTAVAEAMDDADAPGRRRRARAADAFSRWIAEQAPPLDADAALANRLIEVLADPAVTRVDQLPERLHVSVRTLQRIAERFVGLSPHSMIRRRRLQEAAERLREDPSTSISAIAGELGYADHAHFTTDFRAVLGITPSGYRARAAEER